MKVKAIRDFQDLEEQVDRKVGDTWECSQERFEAINSTVYGTLAEKVAPRRTKKED